MIIIVWIVEGTWPACVDAARTLAPDDADIVLLNVRPTSPAPRTQPPPDSSVAATPNVIPATAWNSPAPRWRPQPLGRRASARPPASSSTTPLPDPAGLARPNPAPGIATIPASPARRA
jgi:hypothetical protein